MSRLSIEGPVPRPPANRLAAAMAICAAMLLLPVIPGCGGCSSDETAETKETEEEEDEDSGGENDEESDEKKKKPRYEFVEPVFNVQPSDDTISRRALKPGHWFIVTYHVRANEFDFYGELESQILDSRQQPVKIEHTAYDLLASRPVALPKGEVKHIDAAYFVPRQQDKENQQFWLHFPLKTREGGQLSLKDSEPAIRMPAFQFFFVVLSNNPDRYGFLRTMPSVKPPAGHLTRDYLHYYRVVLPKIQAGQVPLPANGLNWTTVAYLLWDNLDPAALHSQQQTALLDWLHWGGQIIVSGPDALDKLRGSFLDPYLPATKEGAAKLTADRLAELNQEWSLAVTRDADIETQITLHEDRPIAGIELAARTGADYLPHTGQLVAERQVGRGRIVVTAFPLADRSIVGWRNLDGFFNACLLRRPSRRFDNAPALSATWQRHPNLAADPLLISTLRYFSRDMRTMRDPDIVDGRELPAQDEGVYDAQYDSEIPPSYEDDLKSVRSKLTSPRAAHRGQNTDVDDWHFGGYWFWPESGVAGWNDESGVANAARQTLKEAAGIVPPHREDVLVLLAVYLIILVPVNWLIFRLVGRVEWAWLMMPVIAVVGAVVVVWRAQLDIGFVRSRTEVAVLEVHGGYSRGHLTRYTALYSSLSTSFDFTFDNENVQALPFAISAGPDPLRDPDDTIGTVHLRHEGNAKLSGFQVKSNSTAILHSEQMYGLGGTIQLLDDEQGPRVANDSLHALNDVGVLRRTAQGVEVAWVGQLPAESVRPLRFRASPQDEMRLSEWNGAAAMTSFEVEARQLLRQYDTNNDHVLDKFEANQIERIKEFFDQADGRQLSPAEDDESSPVQVDAKLTPRELELCCMLARDGKVGLGRFLDLTIKHLRLAPGEVRLIGWSDQEPGGISINPDVTQTRTQTFVIVHLRPGELPRAQADTNHIADFPINREGGELFLFDNKEEE